METLIYLPGYSDGRIPGYNDGEYMKPFKYFYEEDDAISYADDNDLECVWIAVVNQ